MRWHRPPPPTSASRPSSGGRLYFVLFVHGDRCDRCSVAHSLPAPSSTTRQNAGVGSSVHGLVSEDAPFDARRTAPVKPPPRFVVSADRAASMKRLVVSSHSLRSAGGPHVAAGRTPAFVSRWSSVGPRQPHRQTDRDPSFFYSRLSRAIRHRRADGNAMEGGAFLEFGSQMRPQRRARFPSGCRPEGHLRVVTPRAASTGNLFHHATWRQGCG
jgi:hypothetical protein